MNRHLKKKASIAIGAMTGLLGVLTLTACAASPTDQCITTPDGRTLAYAIQQQGDHARVIFVHGSPANASSWNKLLESQHTRLQGYELVVVDRLGYANSTRGAETSLEAHARALEPLLTTSAILVGHSYGGPVVLRAACDYPDRVGGIVLVAGACDPYMEDSIWFRQLVNAIAPILHGSWATSNRELLALTSENRKMEPLLAQVSCPVAIIHGQRDPVCPHDGTLAYLQNALVSASAVRIVSMPATGHNLHLSHPDRIVDEVLAISALGPGLGHTLTRWNTLSADQATRPLESSDAR